ncbi:hypothetical protein FSPOR_3907 [Fusarium sporotrichioides]|uniref:Saccharopine dehydrogenase NADP binding domain-containing protein n=1 Tax=Fusarium sporotrichioides TaxID=5514 RepID=A0A395SDW9_FUSSP|nr:hypothetical protein FSPOR_3907 [Fusarium sporotrichioides]
MEKFDIVLLGATGFTGRLCAAYMAQVLPETISWAIAGRSKTKLEELYKRIELKRTTCIYLLEVNLQYRLDNLNIGTVYTLDLTSEKAITELVKETRVVINTIGPYATTCGTSVIEACARNGTDYVDCSGEPAWMRDMINSYDEIAQDTGSRIIMTTGWAAVPADLSVYLSILKLRNRYSLPTREVLVCLEDLRGSFSGGSLSSVCSLEPVTMAPFDMSSVPRTDAEIAKHGTIPAPNIFGVQVVDGLGALVQSSHSQIETAIVGRSWGLYAEEGPYSLGPESYGANFFFSSCMKCSNPLSAWAFRSTYTILEHAITKIPPLRYLVTRMFPPGTGPAEEVRKGHYFKYRVVAIADEKEGKPAPRVEVKFDYDGDPYVFTSVALTQAALILLQADTPGQRRGGILTPASLGERFAERLKQPEAGVKIKVKVVGDEVY